MFKVKIAGRRASVEHDRKVHRDRRPGRAAGWGLFVSAAGVHRNEGFRFMIDNGAWSAFTKGLAWTPAMFEAVLERLGADPLCEGIIAPDVVCGGLDSLRVSMAWLDRLLAAYAARVYIPVQPGISPRMIGRYLGPRVGVFVGGDARWKEATCGQWADCAHERGTVCHVGRVNTLRRLQICQAAKVDSFDGSGPSRFEAALHKMERFRAMGAQLAFEAKVVAFCFFEDDGRVFYSQVVVPELALLDTILLAALEAEVPEPAEIQTDAGVYERRGTDYSFATWAQLEEAS